MFVWKDAFVDAHTRNFRRLSEEEVVTLQNSGCDRDRFLQQILKLPANDPVLDHWEYMLGKNWREQLAAYIAESLAIDPIPPESVALYDQNFGGQAPLTDVSFAPLVEPALCKLVMEGFEHLLPVASGTSERAAPTVPMNTQLGNQNNKSNRKWSDKELKELWDQHLIPGTTQKTLGKRYGVTRQRISTLIQLAGEKFSHTNTTPKNADLASQITGMRQVKGKRYQIAIALRYCAIALQILAKQGADCCAFFCNSCTTYLKHRYVFHRESIAVALTSNQEAIRCRKITKLTPRTN